MARDNVMEACTPRALKACILLMTNGEFQRALFVEVAKDFDNRKIPAVRKDVLAWIEKDLARVARGG